MNLNSSPDICSEVPLPDDAKVILPGLALAWAMNSATVRTGSDGGTTMMLASCMMLAIGVVSRT